MDLFAIAVAILLPLVGGLCVFWLPAMRRTGIRDVFMLLVLTLTAASVIYLALRPEQSFLIWQLTEGISFALRVDTLSKVYTVLVVVMWLLVGIFSTEYTKHEDHLPRYYGFYLVSLAALLGVGYADNAVTLYLFFEAMTLLTFPLILHHGDKASIAAALKYLFFSIFGALLALAGIFFLSYYGTTLTFTTGGVLTAQTIAEHGNLLLIIAFLTIVGFGVKAGMFPMQGWLPTAHPVAPAPISAVLSGVTTKAGVMALIRVVYQMFGTEFLKGTWVQYTWMTLALFTVFLGSMLAYHEKLFKKRLAYSTVSQVSYILFGLSLFQAQSMVGGLSHMLFHSIAKDLLFLAAGAIIYKTGKTRVEELSGIGRQMPMTTVCFTAASLSLVGIPLFAGFLSKWDLAVGALRADVGSFGWIGVIVLLISALLTAGYLFPITIHGFMPAEGGEALTRKEAGIRMLVPMLVLAVACLWFGMFPGSLHTCLESIAAALL